jgi:hypothetical protein
VRSHFISGCYFLFLTHSTCGYSIYILHTSPLTVQIGVGGERENCSIKIQIMEQNSALHKNKVTVIFVLRKSTECVMGDCSTFTQAALPISGQLGGDYLSALRQVHSLFRRQFSTSCNLVLPISIYGNCLHLLPSLPFTSILPSIFPSAVCFIRQVPREM